MDDSTDDSGHEMDLSKLTLRASFRTAYARHQSNRIAVTVTVHTIARVETTLAHARVNARARARAHI